MEEPFSTTPTKKWLKSLNMEHIYHVFEEFGFTTLGSLKEMKEEDIDTIFCAPNKLKHWRTESSRIETALLTKKGKFTANV